MQLDPIFLKYLSKKEGGIAARSAAAVLEMHAEGATVPFMARYRKDKTGQLDENQIRAVIQCFEEYEEIKKRKAFILKEVGEQGNLSSGLQSRIELCWDLGELEEIYRPYKKKKKTKATIAKEAGIGPFAEWLWELAQGKAESGISIEVKAKDYLNVAAGFASYELVIGGAKDILIEQIANEASLRELVLRNFMEKGRLASERAKDFKANSKYEMYAKHEEPVRALLETRSSHRYLAMRRAWQEGEISLKVLGDEELLLKRFEEFATQKPESPAGEILKACAKSALNLYVIPSVTNDVHRKLKEKADQDAVRVFGENLRKLLLASPFGPQVVLGVDPGLKSGCKMALVDKAGTYLTHTVFQILGERAFEDAKKLFGEALKQIQVSAIAVGNGTAGRQTEVFIRKVLKELGKDIPVVMVSESGASVYSASEIAQQEFPDLDLTVRGAISIARRLQDPLSELVKVDPKSIGVGQYQHDVGAASLKKSLEAVVESCVNTVGVDLNTASAALLSHISGIGPQTAQSIVDYRKAQMFSDRQELMKVPRLSAKIFEQAAGFLRIQNAKVFLDSTGIHPERYGAVRDMAQELGVSLQELTGAGAKKLLDIRTKWAVILGEHTFSDIVRELEKPGRDPRDPYKVFTFREDIFEVKDLKAEMICPGIVTNVTNFGAFVDIGVHQDGLVHISELAHQFIDDPRKVVSPGDHVQVRVLAVDPVKNQISLSMKLEASPRVEERPRKREDASSRLRRGPDSGAKPAGPFPKASPTTPSRGAGVRDSGLRLPADALGKIRPGNESNPKSSKTFARETPRSSHSSQGRAAPARPPAKPFNNPFAALQGLGGAPNPNKKNH